MSASGSGENNVTINDEVVNLSDFVQQIEDLEEESRAVLGGSDDKVCTYDQGYIKRQALYACLTCSPDVPVGVCLACSYKCHEDHQLVELYTKRNFRCDCPTDRLNGKICFLETTKTTSTGKFKENIDNNYNQNFNGLYCICKRPYPDLENEENNENAMLQCCICEDWYHSNHLNLGDKPLQKELESLELICDECMQKSKLLKDYYIYSVKVEETEDVTGKEEQNDTDQEINKSVLIKNITEQQEVVDIENNDETSSNKNDGDINMKENHASTSAKVNIGRRSSIVDDDQGPSTAKKTKIDMENFCKRPKTKSNYEKGATFWPNEWRELLCTCEKCKNIYKDEKIEFLLDPDDTVEAYENKNNNKSQDESVQQTIMTALSGSGLGHVQKINAIMGINHFKQKLYQFLNSFVSNNEVVTEADVKRFFETMKNQQNVKSLPQYYCR